MTDAEIAPIIKSIEVRCSAAEAFRCFVSDTSTWWPLAGDDCEECEVTETPVALFIEPGAGRRVYATTADGRELEWGRVLVWEPGARFVMSWNLGCPPGAHTRVTVRFEPVSAETCRVTLKHDGWDVMGRAGAGRRDVYDQGWVRVFEIAYGMHAARPGLDRGASVRHHA
jgi:hypothetical protein